MTDISVHSTSHQVENRSWYLGTPANPGFTVSGTLDISAFTAGTHYPDGYIKSGEPLAEISPGIYGPYAAAGATGGDVAEVSTITRTATAGTFVVVANGESSDGIDAGAAVTAAAIQTAIRAISPAYAGVTVTGSAGGPFTVTWTGVAGVLNVTVDDSDATGGTVVVAEATPGAAGARGAGRGLLFASVKVPNLLDTTVDVGAAVLVAFAPIKESKLPRAVDAAFKADVPLLYFVGDAA